MCIDSDVKTFTCPAFLSAFKDRLAVIREEFCDVTLVADGEGFKSHKILLAAHSNYFRSLFVQNSNEGGSDEIKMPPGIHAEAMAALLDYFYSGEIVLSWENIGPVLRATDLMSLDSLRNICIEYIEDTLDSLSCVRYFIITGLVKQSNQSLDNIRKAASVLIVQEAQKNNKNPEFFDLSAGHISKIIKLNNEPEKAEDLYMLILAWVGDDEENRRQFLRKLLKRLPIESISNKFIIQKMKNEGLIRRDLKSLQWLLDNVVSRLANSIALPQDQSSSIAAADDHASSIPASNDQPNSISGLQKQPILVPASHDQPSSSHSKPRSIFVSHDQTNSVSSSHDHPDSMPTLQDQADSVPSKQDQLHWIPTPHDQADSVPSLHDQSDSSPAPHDQADSAPSPAPHGPIESNPTPHEQLDSIPTPHDQAESVPSTLVQLDSAPTLQDQAESVPSKQDQLDSIPTPHDQAESVPSTLDQLDSVPSPSPSLHEQFDPIPTLQDQADSAPSSHDQTESNPTPHDQPESMPENELYPVPAYETQPSSVPIRHGQPNSIGVISDQLNSLLIMDNCSDSKRKCFYLSLAHPVPLEISRRPKISAFSAVCHKNRMYLLCGNPTEESFRLDSLLEPWVDSGLYLDFRRTHAGCIILGNDLYVLGGYDIYDSVLYSCWKYDLALKWKRKIPHMKSNRSSHGVALYANSIYVSCGECSSTFIERFDPREGQWSCVGQYDSLIVDCSSATLDNALYSCDMFRRTFARFDFRNNQSESIHNPLPDDSQPSWITAVNGNLYGATSKEIMKFDAAADEWDVLCSGIDFQFPIMVPWF